MKVWIYILLSLGPVSMTLAQSLQHPIIWVTDDDRSDILQKIKDYPWAKQVVMSLEQRISEKLTAHQNDPQAFLATIPSLQVDDTLTEAQASSGTAAHHWFLISASEAALLYYLFKDEKHARFAADILSYYIEELAPRTPEVTTIGGNEFYDPRSTYPHFAITYDFIYTYLHKPGTRVTKVDGSVVPYDSTKAQMAIRNIVGNVLQEYGAADEQGKSVSNHPVLTAPGALFSILCVEDDVERERLFDVFWNKGTKHQNSFTKTLLPMFGEQGIWPESLSYSFMPNISMILNIVDRIKPELNIIDSNLHILDGVFLFDHLRVPDGRFVRYGDSKRNKDATETLYRYTLNIAQRKNMPQYVQKAQIVLNKAFAASNGYQPHLSDNPFGGFSSFTHLLWGHPVPDTVQGEMDFEKPTVIIKHAGVALQRNYVAQNNEDYGLCGIIGGAHYVHSHVTGITMELYGAGYVMAPNAGLPPNLSGRKTPEHREYFWRHAGNNTMIVNGSSVGQLEGSWNSNLWMNTTVNVAAEPRHLEDPSNPNFSFATQYLGDKVNNCEQQRTLSTIRTSPTTAYYVDVFRSRSLGQNKFHDYIYHNIGDATTIFDETGKPLSLSPTTRYQTDVGDFRKSPGWIHFRNTQVTDPTSSATNIRFDVKVGNRAMHLLLPAGVNREYTQALGPATREAKNGYVDQATQVLAIRQQGEAWNNPYVVILEPSIGQKSSVTEVAHLYAGASIVGVKVTSQVGGRKILDYVICHEDEDGHFELPEKELTFDGRFAVVRFITEHNQTDTVVYIGQGRSLLLGEQTYKGNVSIPPRVEP